MSKIEFFDVFLIIKSRNKKYLVMGDIHIGVGENEVIKKENEEKVIKKIEKVIKKEKEFEEIIILGDIFHKFSKIEKKERIFLTNLLDLLEKTSKKIVIIKGNHDKIIENIIKRKEVEIKEKYEKEDFLFMHGDKEENKFFSKINKKIIIGHYHPAIRLKDSIKEEKYKCFLKIKNKMIILPSLNFIEEGGDIIKNKIDRKLGIKNKDIKVYVVDENGKIFYFRNLNEIISLQN